MAITLSDEQLELYSRHILLPQIDVEGQQRLLGAHILIIGLGGLGSPAAMYLTASGVGQLTLCDYDHVELSNLQRQIIHRYSDLGKTKVKSAQTTLLALNPDVRINIIDSAIQGSTLAQQVKMADIVIDASDNFETRFTINAACVKSATPLISGSAIRFQGQVAVFRNIGTGPCYHCLYSESSSLVADSCSDNGVLAPLVGIIGATMAVEAVKLILNVGKSLDGRLLLLDAETMEWRSLRLPPDPRCPVCATNTLVKSVL